MNHLFKTRAARPSGGVKLNAADRWLIERVQRRLDTNADLPAWLTLALSARPEAGAAASRLYRLDQQLKRHAPHAHAVVERHVWQSRRPVAWSLPRSWLGAGAGGVLAGLLLVAWVAPGDRPSPHPHPTAELGGQGSTTAEAGGPGIRSVTPPRQDRVTTAQAIGLLDQLERLADMADMADMAGQWALQPELPASLPVVLDLDWEISSIADTVAAGVEAPLALELSRLRSDLGQVWTSLRSGIVPAGAVDLDPGAPSGGAA